MIQSYYVVVDGKFRVAVGEPPGPAFTVDLYRSIEDIERGEVLEPGALLTLADDV